MTTDTRATASGLEALHQIRSSALTMIEDYRRISRELRDRIRPAAVTDELAQRRRVAREQLAAMTATLAGVDDAARAAQTAVSAAYQELGIFDPAADPYRYAWG